MLFTRSSESGKEKDSGPENLHTLGLGYGDHQNILFFSFGHRDGELPTNKWVKLGYNRIRGPPENISNPSKSYQIFRLG